MMIRRDDPILLKNVTLFFCIPIFLLLLFACSHIRNIGKRPFKIDRCQLAKGINTENSIPHPFQTSQTFSVLDPEIYAYIRLKDVSGNHRLRWEWIMPDGAPTIQPEVHL